LQLAPSLRFLSVQLRCPFPPNLTESLTAASPPVTTDEDCLARLKMSLHIYWESSPLGPVALQQ